MKRKNRKSVAVLLSILVGPVLAPMAMAQPAITEQEAHAIGVDAYLSRRSGEQPRAEPTFKAPKS
jgi:hypothetical protein